MSSILPNSDTIEVIMTNFVNTCANAWLCNLQQHMRETIARFNSDSYTTINESKEEIEAMKLMADLEEE